MKSMSGGPPMAKSPVPKPHIRMRKMKPVAASAFPTAPAAFPSDGQGPAADPGSAIAAPTGGMPSGAAGGDMGS